MNFGSDHRVRDAFRATLDEKSSVSVLGTQEVDAADVLEVTDLANAIARAEEALRARSSRALGSDMPAPSGADIFDTLLAAGPTDDASGPALHVPYRPTPLPPRGSAVPLPPGITRPATLLRAPEGLMSSPIPPDVGSAPPSSVPLPTPAPAPLPARVAPVNATQPLAALTAAAIPPAVQTAPILILDEDAFYHPAGRIRTMAEVTLDGFRPEPTVLVRIRERRTTLSWVVLLVLAPILLIALFAVAVVVGRASSEGPAVSTPVTVTPQTTAVPQLVAPAPTVKGAPATVAETATPASTDAVPVFDVNSLKSVPAKTRR